MPGIEWGQVTDRFYEVGIDRTVLYPSGGPGVAWFGVTAIDEVVVGGDTESLYRDGAKYFDEIDNVDYRASLSAFSAPVEFRISDGRRSTMRGLILTQQPRSYFGLSYRTLKIDGVGQTSYKIHLVYNAIATPTTRSNKTTGKSVAPLLHNWTINAVPVPSLTHKPTAHLVVDVSRYSSTQIENLEEILYGTTLANPALPTQDVVASILGGP